MVVLLNPHRLPLPSGILKFNFDCSFINDVQYKGYDGVIRDSTGYILCSYSGSVDCKDSNGAEVYALLMGCRKLSKMGTQNVIIEGDFSNSTGIWQV